MSYLDTYKINLNKYLKKDLKDLCKSFDIQNYSNLSKKEIITLLLEREKNKAEERKIIKQKEEQQEKIKYEKYIETITPSLSNTYWIFHGENEHYIRRDKLYSPFKDDKNKEKIIFEISFIKSSMKDILHILKTNIYPQFTDYICNINDESYLRPITLIFNEDGTTEEKDIMEFTSIKSIVSYNEHNNNKVEEFRKYMRSKFAEFSFHTIGINYEYKQTMDKYYSGKWMLFYKRKYIDEKWNLFKKLYDDNKLYGVCSMKVSCANENPRASTNDHVIIFYCDGVETDILKAGNILVSYIGEYTQPYIYYKSNSQTDGGTRATGQTNNHLFKINVIEYDF
jgi:hypothetical protein